MTPSLSCSNKCVFCWRHGTNPVGTSWRWVVDPPDLIFNGIKENQYKKIKLRQKELLDRDVVEHEREIRELEALEDR
ncbi:hypothetical protein NEUTE1DRAFT_136056 [Neurospora tetrasperma FGSC 2508]|uniref:Uncharacterized protein n=1 Tax=Neurospora tetrasperma (strain FGSC 2508 / ATCC MYA-4615 / P0657) TaxID=510951 RepID=F8MIH3_NEUT8|nr:uncharacterized protein NEUTE1DRAFT_136056 [Neurospora tetrasperma FGSC 2508]EGO58977.1 hypothetical protein NEUTE1DRAFT_136056 [Neurospora tetrasperma FGSC 2508]EGZ73077.1 hypothetical protein NEUTE2DRAFT_165247 [Neurospora tetrasperma FGSC 2509]